MIYFDNNATTMLAPEVLTAMMPFLEDSYGNPSSSHSFGRLASEAVESARVLVASFLHADPSEIVFTSSGTESDNWAIRGSMAVRPEMKHVVTTLVEHEAVRNSCRRLEHEGIRVTLLNVDHDGSFDIDTLRKSLAKDTGLVSIMLANNETGVLFPVHEIAAIIKQHSDALFHIDAVNAAGKVSIDLSDPNIDLLSISGHKFHGPKGVGALFVRKGTKLRPLLIGGGQEHGLRSGTEAVHQIVGLGAAAKLASDLKHMERVRALRDRLESGIAAAIPAAFVNGSRDQTRRLPNTSNISFENTNGEAILARLNDLGVCVSTGSACNAAGHTVSPVLQAMNIPYARAMGSIRFSLGRYSTQEEVEFVLDKLPGIVAELRSMSAQN